MSFIIKTAKTIEEAIEAGLMELGLTRDEVDVEVIEEPKTGFLGLLGQKDAMVKVKKKEDISSFVRDILYNDKKDEEKVEVKKPVEEKKEPVKKFETEKREEVKKEEEIKKPVEKEVIVEKIETKEVVEEKSARKKQVIETNDDEDDEDEIEVERSIDEVWSDIEIKNKAEEFLTRVLNEFEVDFSLITELKEDELLVEVKSTNPSDLGIVIGKHGSTLDSLQYLLSQVINKHKEEFIRVTVDANEYRDKRKRSLEKIAKRGVEKLNKFHRPVRLEPMNAADRRIVHMVLQNYENIDTHSEGRDPFRRVVITKNKNN